MHFNKRSNTSFYFKKISISLLTFKLLGKYVSFKVYFLYSFFGKSLQLKWPQKLSIPPGRVNFFISGRISSTFTTLIQNNNLLYYWIALLEEILKTEKLPKQLILGTSPKKLFYDCPFLRPIKTHIKFYFSKILFLKLY